MKRQPDHIVAPKEPNRSLTRHRDDARRRITVRAVGAVALQDILSTVQQQHDDGSWRYAVLYDLRAVGPIPEGPSEVRSLATQVAAIDQALRGPVAVVATDAGQYRRACTYASLIRPLGRRFQVFHDLAEAVLWLDTETDLRD